MELVTKKNKTRFLELFDISLESSLEHNKKYVLVYESGMYFLTHYPYTSPESVIAYPTQSQKRIILPTIEKLLDFDDVELGVVPMDGEVLCFQWHDPSQKLIIVPLGGIV